MLDLTLGIPMKDNAAHLPELLASLAYQSCLPSQILFFDDGSTDSSLQTVQDFAAGHSDWNIAIERHPSSIGIGAVYNRIAAASRRSWVQILDADDYLMKDFYREIAPYLRSRIRGIVTAVRSNLALLNLLNEIVAPFVPGNLPRCLPVLGSLATRSGVIYRTTDLLRTPFIDPAFDGSDILHLIELRANGRFAYVRKARIYYRVHAAAATSRSAALSPYRQRLRQVPDAGWLYGLDYLLRKKIFAKLRKMNTERAPASA